MIEKMAVNWIGQMVKEGLITNTNKEHYIYAFTTLVEKYITLITILTISIILNRLIPMLLFLTFFFTLRKRAGGYHAKHFIGCYLSSVSICIIIIKIHPILLINLYIMYGLLIVSIGVIGMIGTINHPNMDMNHREFNQSKKSTRLIVTLVGCCIIWASIIGVDAVYISFMALAVILCAVLMLLAKIFKQEVKHEEKNW